MRFEEYAIFLFIYEYIPTFAIHFLNLGDKNFSFNLNVNNCFLTTSLLRYKQY